MSNSTNGYISSRVLKLNVGFLLTSGPGHSHDSQIDFPRVYVSEDLTLNYVHGPLRLSRTKEGILLQARLETSAPDECYRCLDSIDHVLTLELEELYANHAGLEEAAFRIQDDAILDMGPLLREEVLIGKSRRTLCREDCRGLCPQCGANLNHVTCSCEVDEIDPRMAELKRLLD